MRIGLILTHRRFVDLLFERVRIAIENRRQLGRLKAKVLGDLLGICVCERLFSMQKITGARSGMTLALSALRATDN